MLSTVTMLQEYVNVELTVTVLDFRSTCIYGRSLEYCGRKNCVSCKCHSLSHVCNSGMMSLCTRGESIYRYVPVYVCQAIYDTLF